MLKENPVSLISKKKSLRQFFKAKRAEIAHSRREEVSYLVTQRIRLLFSNGLVASFFPIHGEINLTPLNHILLDERRLLLPRVESSELRFYKIEKKDQYAFCPYGNSVSIEKAIAILLPGLAFDKRGHRLGYGGGYYDRFLKKNPGLPTLALGFQEQFSPKDLPVNLWDVAAKTLLLF